MTIGVQDGIQNALKAADEKMASLLDMNFVEVDTNNNNDITISGATGTDAAAIKDAADDKGNGTGFYVTDKSGVAHDISNLSGGQWFQNQMENVTKGAQNAATGISTYKQATETVKRAYQ